MVEANLRIIEELKQFLELVSSNASLKKLFTQSESDFTRDRKLTMAKVVGLIINLPKRSLSIEIQEFFDSLSQGLNSSSKAAFCIQRSKLQPFFFDIWNNWLVSCFYKYYGKKVKYWRGFRLLAIDGSTAYLISREDVVNYFGTQDNQHVKIPMARIMQVHDILNDITISGKIYPIKESEQSIISKQVEDFYEDSTLALRLS